MTKMYLFRISLHSNILFSTIFIDCDVTFTAVGGVLQESGAGETGIQTSLGPWSEWPATVFIPGEYDVIVTSPYQGAGKPPGEPDFPHVNHSQQTAWSTNCMVK